MEKHNKDSKDIQPMKKKRKLQKPQKKWSEKEVLNIIEFLEEENEFEKPTAQCFYRKLLKKYKMEVSWDLIRWKVRNMRNAFIKAENFRKSTGAGLMENEGNNLNEKLNKMCRHYQRLRNIFGQKENTTMIKVKDTEENLDRNDDNACSVMYSEEIVHCSYVPKLQSSSTSIQQPPTLLKQLISQLVQMQESRTDYQNKKLEFEKEKFKKEMELKVQQLEVKKRTVDLEQLRIEKEESIKKLEIEKDERIRMRELELKYKLEMEKIK